MAATTEEKVLEEATNAMPNFEVDTNDPQFKEIEDYYDKKGAEMESTFGDMIANNPYNGWEEKLEENKAQQEQNANDRLDQTIKEIEQQREQTQKDYIKEQSAAYVDWQKQSNPYGVNAEKMASAGLTNSGYSESSQVAMYNAYQNRIATAREAVVQAKLQYDNMAAEARLQNSELLQQIADSFLEKSMQLAIDGAVYNNQLVLDLMARQDALRAQEQAEWQGVYDRLWNEQAMDWDVTKYYDNKAFQEEQAQLDRDHQEKLQKLDQDFEAKENALDRKFQEDQAALDRKHDKEMLAAKNKHEKEMAQKNYEYEKKLLAEKLANDKALLDYEYQKKAAAITVSGGGSGSSGLKGAYYGASKTGRKGTSITGNSQATPNMQSVLALGYGPISASYLAQLVASGKVRATEKNGQIYYSKAPQIKQQSVSQSILDNATTKVKQAKNKATTNNTSNLPLPYLNALKNGSLHVNQRRR